jgi:LacI family transcriptional regulator
MAQRRAQAQQKRLRVRADDHKARRPTIRDVARLAEVGVGTVSRVINNHPAVNADIRKVVTNAIAQLRYVPDALAGSMRRNQTHSVACIFRSLTLPGLAPLLSGAESVFSSAGSTLLLGTTQDRESELAQVRSFGQRRIDGIVMTLLDELDNTTMNAIAHYGMKTVVINRDVPEAQGVVLIDHRAGMVEAVGALIGLGHRRIALITLDNKSYPGRATLEGFREAHRAASLTAPEDLIRSGSAHAETAFHETATMLEAPDPPTAIIVGNHALLVGALRVIRNAGLTIGRDISVISNGDSDLTEQMIPPISAIRWDMYEMGRVAAQFLIDSIAGKDQAGQRRMIIPTTFVMRASCHRVAT